MKRSVTLSMAPTPEPFAAVYRKRGMEPPALSSSFPLAALWPYEWRHLHRLYARSHGYYWLPCVLCQREYGGHEITESIPDPIEGPDRFQTICPVCAAERNGGHP